MKEFEQFAKRVGIRLLEDLLIIFIGVLIFPYFLKAFEWFISLYGYTL